MSRRPALVTQADVARSIRAAKQAGAGSVEIRTDGTIFIHLSSQEIQKGEIKPVAKVDRPPL